MIDIALSLLSGAWKGLVALVQCLLKPPGLYVLLVLLVLLAIWWSGQRGYDRGMADCQATHKASAAQVQAARQTAAAGAVQASQTRTAAAKIQDQTNGEIVADVKARAEALPPPPASCPPAVPADLADRLRGLQ